MIDKLTLTLTPCMIGVMRKQEFKIHLDAPLIKWLRAEAKRRKVSIGEVVRIAIQQLMSK